MGKMIIYQVLTRLWGKGKFSEFDFPRRCQYYKSLGVSHVWYHRCDPARHNGLGREGATASDSQIVKGAAGSPYAITDYYDVNPHLADNPTERMTEFEALLKRSHDAGLKVIIDFVPNHVSGGITARSVWFTLRSSHWVPMTIRLSIGGRRTISITIPASR